MTRPVGRPAGPHSLRFRHIGRPSNCVYLVEFSDALVKVGFSNNPQTRLRKLSFEAARQGVEILRYHVFVGNQGLKRLHDPQRNELRSIRALQAIKPPVPGCFETFHGIPFDTALAVVASAVEA